MKTFLRIVAVFVGLSVLVTLAWVLRFAVGGLMTAFIHSVRLDWRRSFCGSSSSLLVPWRRFNYGGFGAGAYS